MENKKEQHVKETNKPTVLLVNILSVFLAVILVLSLYAAGNLLKTGGGSALDWMTAIYLLVFAVTFFMLWWQPARAKKFVKQMKERKVASFQQEFTENKKMAREAHLSGDYLEVSGKLRKSIVRAKVFFGLLFFNLLLLAFFSAFSVELYLTILTLLISLCGFFGYAYQLFNLLLCRFDWSRYEKPEDYPVIYGIVQKAAKACGINSKIRIIFIMEANAGICKVGRGKNGDISIQIGIDLLYLEDEEELYNVMLHEFSHLNFTDIDNPTNCFFCQVFLFDSGEDHLLARMVNIISAYHGTNISYYSFMFSAVTSEFVEEVADNKAAELGNRGKFASSLIKLAMYDRAKLLIDDYYEADHLYFLSEEALSHMASYQQSLFRKIFNDHSARWYEAFKTERQPQNATHPIVRERIKNVGVEYATVQVQLPDTEDNTPYRIESRKATEKLDLLWKETNEPEVEGVKKEYDKLMEDLKEYWEKGYANPEKYKAIIGALSVSCQYKEMVEFCRQIAEDSNIELATKSYPVFCLGKYLLNHDDPEGLAMVYAATDDNANYIDEAIDVIGSYCCRNGLDEEYEEYHRKAEEWRQNELDIYSQRDMIRGTDDLSCENFSEEKMKEVRESIVAAGEGHLKAIYLVHKHINDSEEGYVTPVVLEFEDDADEEAISTVSDRVFNYLDTVPDGWNYSLHYYNKELGRILAKVPNSCIWRKEEQGE